MGSFPETHNDPVTLSTCQKNMKVSCTLRFKRSFYHSKLKLNVNFSWTVSTLFKSIAHFLLELHSKRGEDGGYDRLVYVGCVCCLLAFPTHPFPPLNTSSI